MNALTACPSFALLIVILVTRSGAAQPAAPLGRIREYVRRLCEKNPHTAVVFMATTRAPSRRAKWPQLDELNQG